MPSLKSLCLTGFSNMYIDFSKNIEISVRALVLENQIIALRAGGFYIALHNCRFGLLMRKLI